MLTENANKRLASRFTCLSTEVISQLQFTKPCESVVIIVASHYRYNYVRYFIKGLAAELLSVLNPLFVERSVLQDLPSWFAQSLLTNKLFSSLNMRLYLFTELTLLSSLQPKGIVERVSSSPCRTHFPSHIYTSTLKQIL